MRTYLAAVTCATLLSGFTVETATAGAIYDLSADFSAISNPNGVWTYGDETVLGGALKLYTAVPPSQASNNGGLFDVWGDTSAFLFGPYVDPSVLHNSSATTVTSFGGIQLPSGGVSLHPGYSGEYSVARFTAPSAGNYTLDFNFTSADTRGGGATADFVLDDGAILYSGHIDGPIGAGNFGLSNVSLDLAAGDHIDFVVGQYEGHFYYDATQVSATFSAATFSATPEPSTWAMLLIGFAGLAYAGYRAPRGLAKAPR